MVHDRTDPGEQVPEADLLEQRTPLDPRPLTDPSVEVRGASVEADEADRWEQANVVPEVDEDDYPHESTGDGWS